MQTITRVGPLSLGKLLGGVSAVFGVLFGLLFTVLSVFGATAAAFDGAASEGLIGLVFGIGALFIMPVFYGLFGFLQGLLTAFLVNLAMRFFGGLEVTIEG